ncbi:MazG-like family protein [Candidatus Woesearchaeota archaeon]|nr:MazG-like family protein [Candidatus Woesearchaeota archaeon]
MLEIQKRIKEFVEANNLKAKPEFRMLDIVSETGEVAKEILKMTDYGRKEEEYNDKIEGEVGDLLFSLMCLANNYGIDVEKATSSVLEKYEKRLKKGSAGSEVE